MWINTDESTTLFYVHLQWIFTEWLEFLIKILLIKQNFNLYYRIFCSNLFFHLYGKEFCFNRSSGLLSWKKCSSGKKNEYWVYKKKQFETVIVKQLKLPLPHNRLNQLWVTKCKREKKEPNHSKMLQTKAWTKCFFFFVFLLVEEQSQVLSRLLFSKPVVDLTEG